MNLWSSSKHVPCHKRTPAMPCCRSNANGAQRTTLQLSSAAQAIEPFLHQVITKAMHLQMACPMPMCHIICHVQCRGMNMNATCCPGALPGSVCAPCQRECPGGSYQVAECTAVHDRSEISASRTTMQVSQTRHARSRTRTISNLSTSNPKPHLPHALVRPRASASCLFFVLMCVRLFRVCQHCSRCPYDSYQISG